MESSECNGENVCNFRSYTVNHKAILEMDTKWPDCLLGVEVREIWSLFIPPVIPQWIVSWGWKLERFGAFLSHQSFLSAFHNLRKGSFCGQALLLYLSFMTCFKDKSNRGIIQNLLHCSDTSEAHWEAESRGHQRTE